ncbi:MAG: hypothetical protein AB8I08_23830 [Sandaracinaceae bacterium]
MTRLSTTRAMLFALLTVFASGCFESHGRRGEPPPSVEPPRVGGGPCGPVTCPSDEVCCNSSCGICTPISEPETGCFAVHCGDGGPYIFNDASDGEFCGSRRCIPGALCCRGCDGLYCTSDDVCPDPVCPPERCASNRQCADDEYCRFEDGSCGGLGECTARPTGCTDDCPGVCGCDGTTYCNECEAAAVGQALGSLRACEWEPPMGPCDFLSYCECTAQPGCAPLVDLREGCICTCDDPFNCTGIDCDCDCAGAEFLRCAPETRCDEPEVSCPIGLGVVFDAEGCPRCASDP